MSPATPPLPGSRPATLLAALVIIMAGIKLASSIVIPVLLAFFIAVLCNPPVKFMERLKVPRIAGISIVIASILIVLTMLVSIVGTSAKQFTRNLPQYREQLETEFRWIIDQLAERKIELNADLLTESFDPGAAVSVFTNTLAGVSGAMSYLVLVLLTVIFMMLEGPWLGRKLRLILPDPAQQMRPVKRFISSLNHYVALKSAISAVTGLLVSVMLWIKGVDFFILWGVMACLLNFIPNIGSMIAAVPAVLLTVISQGFADAGLIAAGYVVINMVMGNVLEPRIMGNGLGLSTIVVFLSLVFWGWLLGPAGMILSVPLTMIVKIALETTPQGHRYALLLGSTREVEEEEKGREE